jgi:hypothetical protein
MNSHLFSGTANLPLAAAVARGLDRRLGDGLLEQLPHGEGQTHVLSRPRV